MASVITNYNYSGRLIPATDIESKISHTYEYIIVVPSVAVIEIENNGTEFLIHAHRYCVYRPNSYEITLF